VPESPEVARGGVWLTDLPEIPPRPAVVVTRTEGNARRRNVIVAVVTSYYPPRRPSEIGLDERNGLQHASTLQTNELYTVKVSRLIEHRGALDAEQGQSLNAALRFTLDLDYER
jgi:mRNA-degrading endonuclease toxin of MazEF toxin-antitoxin module